MSITTRTEDKRQEAQVFLQQAETVRLGQKGDAGIDSFVRVTELKTLSKEDGKIQTRETRSYFGSLNVVLILVAPILGKLWNAR